MRNLVEPSRSRGLSRVAILALIAAGAAGCSSDVSRFNESPFAARKAPPQSEVTGSVQPAPAPTGRVEAQPLPAPGAPRTISAGSPGIGSYPPPAPEVTGTVQRPTVISAPPAPRSASPAPPVSATQGVHVIAPGETIYSVARHYKKSPGEIARANKLDLAHKVRIGDRLVIPGVSAAQRSAAPAQPQAPKQIAAKPDAPAVKQTATIVTPRVTAPPKVASNDAPPTARVITPAADPVEPAQVAETTGATPSFRWPVRGRIISLPHGQQNDGINLAVPEGTQIKAAESGTVAYAGNELKGYGNLILLRHANGFVTAYAHASELTVKKGEIVKRGQVIAKAGATGSVTSPQLHFEIRKGATPVDPVKYLAD